MSPVQKGPISQRQLLVILKPLIDDAMAGNSTAHKDIAKAKLREIMATANWNTPFLGHNLTGRRVRYLASIGYYYPMRFHVGQWHGKVEPKELDDD